jgi:hypothetical protein
VKLGRLAVRGRECSLCCASTAGQTMGHPEDRGRREQRRDRAILDPDSLPLLSIPIKPLAQDETNALKMHTLRGACGGVGRRCCTAPLPVVDGLLPPPPPPPGDRYTIRSGIFGVFGRWLSALILSQQHPQRLHTTPDTRPANRCRAREAHASKQCEFTE